MIAWRRKRQAKATKCNPATVASPRHRVSSTQRVSGRWPNVATRRVTPQSVTPFEVNAWSCASRDNSNDIRFDANGRTVSPTRSGSVPGRYCRCGSCPRGAGCFGSSEPMSRGGTCRKRVRTVPDSLRTIACSILIAAARVQGLPLSLAEPVNKQFFQSNIQTNYATWPMHSCQPVRSIVADNKVRDSAQPKG